MGTSSGVTTPETDLPEKILTSSPGVVEGTENDIMVEPTLNDELIDHILTALDDSRDDDVREFLDDLTAGERAELLSKVRADDRAFLIDRFPEAFEAEVFSWLDEELARQTLEGMTPIRVAHLLSDLETDDAVNLIDDLDPSFQKQVLRHLSAQDRAVVEEGLAFEEDSAGRLMSRDFVAIPRFWTVGKTIDYAREAGEDELPDDFTEVFVIDPMYKVVGEIPLNRILRAKRSTKIEDLSLEDIHPIPADMDQEDVARLFSREGLTSAPVVDAAGRLIGVISIDDVVDVIEEEAQEDILRLGGVGGSDLYRDFLQTTRLRFGWLFVNLMTAMLSASVISMFEATLQQVIALAILMPIVASMGGNAGTQTLTITVRALATKELSRTNMARVVIKETAVGFMNGTAFAVMLGLIAGFWFSNHVLGVVIGLAMVINLVCAGLFGILIPLTLDKFKIDPALASSIFLTTVTDVVGFFGFLGLATWMML